MPEHNPIRYPGLKPIRRSRIYEAIDRERVIQDMKFGLTPGNWDSLPSKKLAVLTEEVGEVAKDILENNLAGLYDELIQVAAVAIAMLESLHLDNEKEDW